MSRRNVGPSRPAGRGTLDMFATDRPTAERGVQQPTGERPGTIPKLPPTSPPWSVRSANLRQREVGLRIRSRNLGHGSVIGAKRRRRPLMLYAKVWMPTSARQDDATGRGPDWQEPCERRGAF